MRAGLHVSVIDRFGDVDTRDLADTVLIYPDTRPDFANYNCLKSLVDEIATGPEVAIVIGSGFDSCPRVLEALAIEFPVMANSAQIFCDIKYPARFFPDLDLLGIPHPQIRLDKPGNGDWLAKRIGGSGGAHIVPATATAGVGVYFQQQLTGQSYSLVFLADGHDAVAIGLNRTWCRGQGPHPFVFAGAVTLSLQGQPFGAQLLAMAGELTRHYRLQGICGMDVMVSSETGDVSVLELNPRPVATLSLHDDADQWLLAHLAVFQGRTLSPPPEKPLTTRAMQVLYAGRDTEIPEGVAWPEWVADIPQPGQLIRADQACCTVYASAGCEDETMSSLEYRCRELKQRIFTPSPSC